MDKRFWVGFNLVKGIGAVRLQALREHFGDLSLAWQAPLDALQAAGLSQKIAERVIQARASVDLDRFMEQIAAQGIQVLTWEDEAYPSRLKEIDQPPPILYLRGELTIEDSWAVAVVGTRRVTAYGRQVTEELASYLAQNGVTVVSGLARGVDAISHQAALKAGGRTLAVMGNGVDRIYPPEHRALAEQILENGALLSDYAPGTPPDSGNFPPRNRIIAGLSAACVVVEAGDASGALITAEFALEQGRDVFAVPGNIFSPASKGPNKLISDGARPACGLEDLLEELKLRFRFYREGAQAWIGDRDNPGQRLWRVDVTVPTAEDFALVSRVHDPSTGHIAVIAAGLTHFGTGAAGEFLSSPQELEELARQIEEA